MIRVRPRRFTARVRSPRGAGRHAKAARIRSNQAFAARFIGVIATALRALRNAWIVKRLSHAAALCGETVTRPALHPQRVL